MAPYLPLSCSASRLLAFTWLAGAHNTMLPDKVFKKVMTNAAGNEGRDEDVRVERDPHETHLDTSSSE